jgi:hypothetical protein
MPSVPGVSVRWITHSSDGDRELMPACFRTSPTSFAMLNDGHDAQSAKNGGYDNPPHTPAQSWWSSSYSAAKRVMHYHAVALDAKIEHQGTLQNSTPETGISGQQ